MSIQDARGEWLRLAKSAAKMEAELEGLRARMSELEKAFASQGAQPASESVPAPAKGQSARTVAEAPQSRREAVQEGGRECYPTPLGPRKWGVALRGGVKGQCGEVWKKVVKSGRMAGKRLPVKLLRLVGETEDVQVWENEDLQPIR